MNRSLSISVLSTIKSASLLSRAQYLADCLDLPFSPSLSKTHSGPILAYTDDGLQLLQFTDNGALRRLLSVDFVKGKNGFRHRNNLTTKQPLARAIGIKPGLRPAVFDATAGLGADSFALACLGCRVSMCERSPILHTLLQDGLRRAVLHPETREIIETRMELLSGDSLHLLQRLNSTFHTVYLDPMYPHREKSALNKLEMRVIRELVGDDEDCDKLLEAAMTAAENRVVVKRPKGAEKIPGPQPSYTVQMKNSRFDIYL